MNEAFESWLLNSRHASSRAYLAVSGVDTRMEEAFLAGRLQRLDEAAKVCEEEYPELIGNEEVFLPCFDGGKDCATAILALKEKP